MCALAGSLVKEVFWTENLTVWSAFHKYSHRTSAAPVNGWAAPILTLAGCSAICGSAFDCYIIYWHYSLRAQIRSYVYHNREPFGTQIYRQSHGSIRRELKFTGVSLSPAISKFNFPVLLNFTSKDLGLVEYERGMQLDRKLYALSKFALLISLNCRGS